MILAAVWSMSALPPLVILSTHFEMTATFFPSLRFGGNFFKSFGRIGFLAHTKTASRENTSARSVGEHTEVGFLFGSACTG